MKIRTIQGTILTELFHEIIYHESLGTIVFSYRYIYEEDGDEAIPFFVQMPMTFSNPRHAREAFRRYLRARNTGQEMVSLIGLGGRWPKAEYRKIINHKKNQLKGL